MQPVYVYTLGVAATVVAALVVLPLRSGLIRTAGLRPWLAIATLLVPAVALLAVGDGHQAESTVARRAVDTMPTPPTGALRDDADWAMISHAFLGGPPPGRSGGQPDNPGRTSEPAPSVDIGALEERARTSPQDGAAWLALAQAHRVARDFPQAVTAYEAALKIEPGSADAWADYADALAATNGHRLAGKPAEAIKRALQLEPQHLKGLWLQASLDLEEHDYGAALKRWRQLRGALPPGSPDIAIIDANISEARALAGQAPPGAPRG